MLKEKIHRTYLTVRGWGFFPPFFLAQRNIGDFYGFECDPALILYLWRSARKEAYRISSFIPSYVMFMRVGYNILKFNLLNLLKLYSYCPASSRAKMAMFCDIAAHTDVDTPKIVLHYYFCFLLHLFSLVN